MAYKSGQCKVRDGDLCILTGLLPAEVAHIFPFSLMKNSGSQQSNNRTDFWTLLTLFWTKEHIEKWRKAIFPDASNPNDWVDSCENLVTLNSYAHTIWNNGCFALKPVRASNDGKELDLFFFLAASLPSFLKGRSLIDSAVFGKSRLLPSRTVPPS